MKTNTKTSWTRKALNAGLVTIAAVMLLLHPTLGATVAAALVIAWAIDSRAPRIAASYAAGCANASSSAVAVDAEPKPAEKAPSKREVMRCWVALF